MSKKYEKSKNKEEILYYLIFSFEKHIGLFLSVK
jgi:hypothetical protein